jgi:ABC-type branched-subunit amino acid transport system ATPase component
LKADNSSGDKQSGEMLSVKGVSKSFGGIKAVEDCHLSVKEGSIVGLIGPNGAGKSTLFEIVTGFQRPDSGQVIFQKENMVGLPSFQIARRGLIRTFQIPRALNKMTVLENMMLAPQLQKGEKIWNVFLRWPQVRKQEKRIRDKALSVLEFFDLIHMADEYAGALSGGQKKLLALARALMTDPKLLLLDEPFAGVNPTLSKKLIGHVKELREEGITFLVIEHGIPYIMELSDVVYVLNKGEVMTHGRPEEVISDRRVLEAYLGEDHAQS